MIDTHLADVIHAEKYRAPNESFREWANRVASFLKDDDDHFWELRDAIMDQRILHAGRIQAGAGSPRRVTLLNCYVSPTIQDSFTDGDDSIMGVATKAARTMRMGGGIGYDFSSLRPRGSRIASLASASSGPVSFMEIFDAVCRATSSAGNRRGAQMGVLRVDHPDIEEFVRAKQSSDRLSGFNVSVAVTDEFMSSVKNNLPFVLRWGGREYGSIDARSLWEEIMRSTWDWAEPGVLFIDRINEMNNLRYCEEIMATNPCGEQPLPPNGACLLGSINLVKYVLRPDGIPREGSWRSFKHIDYTMMARDIRTLYVSMDNVIDRTIYPLPDQEAEEKTKRRIGMGVTGLANAVEAMGFPYGSEGFLAMESQILEFVRDRVYTESVVRASEKGPFPAFDRDLYMSGEFIKSLPESLVDLIGRHGIRNSHLTSIAPTGTISLCAGNVSSGIEPVYGFEDPRTKKLYEGDDRYRGTRKILLERGPEFMDVEDYGFRVFGTRGKVAQECSVDDHLNVLATAQQFVDSAVSKTINVDPSTPWEDFKSIYTRAWELGCKGVTTFNPSGKRSGIFSAPQKLESGEACYVDPTTGSRSCDQ